MELSKCLHSTEGNIGLIVGKKRAVQVIMFARTERLDQIYSKIDSFHMTYMNIAPHPFLDSEWVFILKLMSLFINVLSKTMN